LSNGFNIRHQRHETQGETTVATKLYDVQDALEASHSKSEIIDYLSNSRTQPVHQRHP
jgi:hypothetical protein